MTLAISQTIFSVYKTVFYSFECYQFVVTSSVLNNTAKDTLKQNLPKCQGKYVEKWSNKCTHLVVNEFMLTIKVLLALIEEIPIVTPDYFTEYGESVESGTEPPDINKFNKPPITEQLLKSDFKYQYDSRRRHLFKNKIFVFLKASSRNQMEDVIKACGKQVLLFFLIYIKLCIKCGEIVNQKSCTSSQYVYLF